MSGYTLLLNRIRRRLPFLVALTALVSCSDAGLQALDEEITTYDNKLKITAEYCTSAADEVAFPVKILIVMDQSASLQCTDPANNRITGLNMAGASLDAQPDVEFGVVGFASWSKVVEFTNNWWEAQAALAPEDGQGGPATDYQGSLSTVLSMLEQDMMAAGPAEVARTRYIVLFLSDGIPEPRCRAGCDDGEEPPDSLYGVCNTSKEISDNEYVDMYSECPEYNQNPQILQKVQDIMMLGDFYGVGSLEFNTIFLFAPEEVVQQACGEMAATFGYVREEAEPLLRSMADTGLGTFRDVNTSTEIDFLNFDYQSLVSPYEMKTFFAVNMSSVPGKAGSLVDSDRDGLDDAAEFDLGLTRLTDDSDGDSFGDLLEYTYSNRGFDPNDPQVPAIGCASSWDEDGDGLRNCEESFLKTDPRLVDTDGDRLPDGIELRFGLDPLVKDTQLDHDFDDTGSGLEIRNGTNPKLYDEEESLVNRMLYSVTPSRTGNEGTQCYTLSVQEIPLVKTLNLTGEPGGRGTNRILLFAEQEPMNRSGVRGIFHVACVEARYLGETYKDPPSGAIKGLSWERFVELPLFDPAIHCLKPGEDPTSAFPEEVPP